MSSTFIVKQRKNFFAMFFKKLYIILFIFAKTLEQIIIQAFFTIFKFLIFAYISRAKSKVGAFATIALDDIISTPVDAIALTVSNFTFPLASTTA